MQRSGFRASGEGARIPWRDGGRRLAHVALRGADAFAEAWLGLERPPAWRAQLEADWMPEGVGGACLRCGVTRAGRVCAHVDCPRAHIDGVVRLSSADPALRAWLHAVKFGGWFDMADRLGRQLAVRLAVGFPDVAAGAVVVPIPMPWPRRLVRGIDHARAIAEGVAQGLGRPIECRVLVRRPGARRQVGQARTARRAGGLGIAAGSSSPSDRLAGRPVILVDDVLTTGTTVAAGAARLRRLGAEPVIVAVAGVVDRAR